MHKQLRGNSKPRGNSYTYMDRDIFRDIVRDIVRDTIRDMVRIYLGKYD